MEIKRGEIWIVNKYSTTVDSGKTHAVDLRGRPVVIVSNDIGNKHSPTVEIVPLTTRSNHSNLPTHVKIKSAHRVSYIMTENIATVDKNELFKKIGRLTSDEILRLNAVLSISVGISCTT